MIGRRPSTKSKRRVKKKLGLQANRTMEFYKITRTHEHTDSDLKAQMKTKKKLRSEVNTTHDAKIIFLLRSNERVLQPRGHWAHSLF
jgi:hypothetical protein